MKLMKHEQTAPATMELELHLEPEQYKQAVSDAYKKNGKKYNLPGFRKGHAPRNLIEKMYGSDVFTVDAVNEMFPAAFEQAVEELGIETISQPEAEILSANETDGVTLKVTVKIKPEIKIGQYTGLSGTRIIQPVEDARVEDEIGRMRERNARILTREGEAAIGDMATIDYEGSVNGELFDGGADKGHTLTLGSGQFIPGFEEQVVGHKAGEEFDVKVTFPAEYHAEQLAGQDAVFKVNLHEVRYKELPALDDEFAKDVSEFDTLDELRSDIRAKMQKTADEQADMELENKLVEQIVETIEGEIPEEMYQNRMDEMVRDFAFRLEQQGLNLPTYLQYTGMDQQSFRDGFREQAEKAVKMRLVLETVARLENIEATDEDLEAEIAKIAERYEMDTDKVRELMPAEEIKKDLAVNKALEFIKSKATVTDAPPEKADAGDKEKK